MVVFGRLLLIIFNSYPADHDYCHFQSVYLLIKPLLMGVKWLFKHKDLNKLIQQDED